MYRLGNTTFLLLLWLPGTYRYFAFRSSIVQGEHLILDWQMVKVLKDFGHTCVSSPPSPKKCLWTKEMTFLLIPPCIMVNIWCTDLVIQWAFPFSDEDGFFFLVLMKVCIFCVDLFQLIFNFLLVPSLLAKLKRASTLLHTVGEQIRKLTVALPGRNKQSMQFIFSLHCFQAS